jgi:adenine-specific DNA-methyltransferase
MSSCSALLGSMADIYCGIATGPGKETLIKGKKLSNAYKPLIEGKDVGRYLITFRDRYILYDRAQLHRARKESIFLTPEKLITQRIAGGKNALVVAYDDQQFYTFNSTNAILPKEHSPYSLKYILAILNSPLLNWFYIKSFTNRSELTVNISQTFLKALPIRKIAFIENRDKSRHDEISAACRSTLDGQS